MTLEEKLEQEKKMVIEIPMLLAESVRNMAKGVKPNEYVLMAIVEKLKTDILTYRTAASFADNFLQQYEQACQAKKKKE